MSENVLILPHLRIQNANAISGPLTWGFPAMTAFVGLMHALERQCQGKGIDVHFDGIGVVCHSAIPQTNRSVYGQHSFLLTRNPLKSDGKTAAIVEEGRMHIEVSLIFTLSGDACNGTPSERDALAQQLDAQIHRMRIAGGSVLPRSTDSGNGRRYQAPLLEPLGQEEAQHIKQLNRIKRRLLPGFALVLRDDVLEKRLKMLQETQSDASVLDAWLDLSRFNYGYDPDLPEKKCWTLLRRSSGWLVPIPIGYSALSNEIPADKIANARDSDTPLRFVEPLFSIGEWRSPHRFKRIEEMLWHVRPNTDDRLFLLDMCAKPFVSDSDAYDADAEPELDTTDY